MSYWTVTVTKRRTGETFTGVMADDGLQSLFTVHTETGTKYASVLDSIRRVEQVDATTYKARSTR